MRKNQNYTIKMPNLRAAFIIGLIINKVDKVVIISTVTFGLAKYCKVIIESRSGECHTGWGDPQSL